MDPSLGGQLLERLRFQKHDRRSPDDGGLVVVVQNADALGILPPHFSSEQIARDQFHFDFIAVLDEGLDLANAGQGGF